MRICGIVAEYNPFHNGHKYQIEKLREAGFDAVVAVMSGNFVQRGEPAFADKHIRARQALLNGIDLVIELPLPFAVAPAERFALGSVSLLNSLCAVDAICFGSECGEIEVIKKIAEANLNDKIDEYITLGISYPAAVQKSTEQSFGSEYSDILSMPNNILAVEYVRALRKLSSRMEPFTVKRIGIEHDSANAGAEYASAQFIRNNYLDESIAVFLPESSFEIMKSEIEIGKAPARLKNAERAVLALLRSRDKDFFKRLPDISEGIENRLYSAIRQSVTVDELYNSIKTKRYPMSRVKRLVLNAALGVTDEFSASLPPYIRVIGMNEKGMLILKQAKEKATKPILTLSSDFEGQSDEIRKLYSLECRATDFYSLLIEKPDICGKEQTNNAVIIK